MSKKVKAICENFSCQKEFMIDADTLHRISTVTDEDGSVDTVAGTVFCSPTCARSRSKSRGEK